MIEPVFIVSAGRSGSSVFHDVFSYHPDVAWLTPLMERYPGRPALNRHALRLAGLGMRNPFRKFFYPVEGYAFWNHHYRGFSNAHRDLRAGDVTSATRMSLRGAFERLVTGRRRRPVLKITGWPRMTFLSEIFPEARFIHLVRDGRAVAHSLMRTEWWGGWRGPRFWRFGRLGERYRSEWERFDRSYVALAGIEWKLVLDALQTTRSSISGDRLLDIRYEDLCARPLETFDEVVAFCDLPESGAFERYIRDVPWRNANDSWRSNLTSRQQEILGAVTASHLARYEYDRNPRERSPGGKDAERNPDRAYAGGSSSS